MVKWSSGAVTEDTSGGYPVAGTLTRGNGRISAGRIARTVAALLGRVRAHPLLNPLAAAEVLRERLGGHPVLPDHGPHLREAVNWLVRAQDATGSGGVSRGYSLVWHPHFRLRGWQAAYPETTGYIIPTLYEASRRLGQPDLAERAERAARWEIAVQLPSGAVQGGVIGEGESPAVFNTGQVILGWLAAFRETGDPIFADAARRAGRFLVAMLDGDGHWRSGNSAHARQDSTLYNARVAWALAEAGAILGEPGFTDAAHRNLCAVASRQHRNGWLPDCCLADPERPLLHTLAYAIRGLLEGGRVLEDTGLITAAARAAGPLLEAVQANGWMSGRFAADWSPAASWNCLTGEAQMANNWMRLSAVTGEAAWLDPVPRVLAFLKSTQNRRSRDPGLRGGIKGSAPIGGWYGRYELLNWAAKFFADALMRHDRLLSGAGAGGEGSFGLG